MTRIATKVDQIKHSATITVSAQAMDLKAQGKDIISLSAGEPDFDTPVHIREAAIAAIHAGKTRYTQVDGTPELKNAIARKFREQNGLEFTTSQIIASNGAKQSLYNLMVALLNRDDEVIVPAPYWVSYPDMVKLADAEPAILSASPENDYKITARELQNSLNENTRMLILNSPSNPTGKVYSGDEYRALGDVLLEHPKVFIVCDDIYEHIYWGESPYRTFLNSCPELVRTHGRDQRCFQGLRHDRVADRLPGRPRRSGQRHAQGPGPEHIVPRFDFPGGCRGRPGRPAGLPRGNVRGFRTQVPLPV